MAKRDPLLKSKRKLAHQLLQLGRIAQARDVFAQICRRDRLDIDAWLNYGALSGRLGHYADAESAFKRAIKEM